MPIASGTQARITYLAEVTRGTTPGSGTWIESRLTSRNINLEKNILESAEIRSSRQRADVRHGFNRVVGSLGFQASHLDQDDFYEKCLGSTFASTMDTGSTTLSVVDSTNSIDRASGSFVSDDFRPGDIVTISGFTGGIDGDYTVASVGALALVLVEDLGVDQAAAASRQVVITGARLGIGTTNGTFSIERSYLDVVQHQVFAGCSINELAMSISPEAIANGTFGIIGMSAGAMSGSSASGTPTPSSANDIYAAFDGTLYEGGVAIAVCTSVDFSVNNSRTTEGVVGSKFTPDIFDGTAVVTGNATFFFENATLLNKFINETESQLSVKLASADGTKFLNISFPRVKYNGGSMDPPQNGPVSLVMPFEALEPTVTGGSSIYLQRSTV